MVRVMSGGLDHVARELVRLACWEWLPGMAWVGALDGVPVRGRLLSPDDLGDYDDPLMAEVPRDLDDLRPRLDDPAAEGLLLALYRKASGDDGSIVMVAPMPVPPVTCEVGWQVTDRYGNLRSQVWASPVLALVDALKRVDGGVA